MMDMTEKKKRAAVAAALYYLECEMLQEAEAAEATESAGAAEIEAPQTAAAPGAPAWALSGRQAQMQMRTMVQMKAFH